MILVKSGVSCNKALASNVIDIYFANQSTLHTERKLMENSAEQNSDPLAMLATAHEMIARTKSTVVDRSFYYFLWGLLVCLACLMTFVLGQRDPQQVAWLPWAILMPLGAIVSAIRLGKNRKHAHVQTYAEHTYDGVWLATGLGAAVIVLGNPIVRYFPPQAIYVLLSILIGIAVYSSGHIMELLSFKLGGLLWWCGAVVMMLLPDKVHPLIMAAVIIPGYIVPGYLLWRSVRASKQNGIAGQ